MPNNSTSIACVSPLDLASLAVFSVAIAVILLAVVVFVPELLRELAAWSQNVFRSRTGRARAVGAMRERLAVLAIWPEQLDNPARIDRLAADYVDAVLAMVRGSIDEPDEPIEPHADDGLRRQQLDDLATWLDRRARPGVN
jgi:hypothetical protein